MNGSLYEQIPFQRHTRTLNRVSPFGKADLVLLALFSASLESLAGSMIAIDLHTAGEEIQSPVIRRIEDLSMTDRAL